jgi:hypothetical protein
VAVAAAYVLFVQSLLGAIAAGAHAGPVFDVVGSVICSSGEAKMLSRHGDGPSQRHHLPDCCLAGCSMFSPALPAALGISETSNHETRQSTVNIPAFAGRRKRIMTWVRRWIVRSRRVARAGCLAHLHEGSVFSQDSEGDIDSVTIGGLPMTFVGGGWEWPRQIDD